ncbi:sugar transferase [Propionibacteriaceae bacterium Y1923]|uniref:sugar transferase n=1 Tax=Aestuariimicrobium sp. Y1814 TaxID=3418742 RepID=UPI003C1F44FB
MGQVLVPAPSRPLLQGAHRAHHQGRWTVALTLFAVDAVLVALSCTLALNLRSQLTLFGPTGDVMTLVAPVMALFIGTWLVTLVASGAYRQRLLGAGTTEYSVVARASVLTAAVIGISAYLADYPLSRAFFFLAFIIGTPALLLGRLLMRRVLHAARRRGAMRLPVLVVGDPFRISDFSKVLHRETWIGYDVVGALTHDTGYELPHEIAVLGTPHDALSAVHESGARAVIFLEGSFRESQDFNKLARELEREHAQLIVVPSLTELSSTRVDMQTIAGVPLLTVAKPQAVRAGRWVKRSFDIIVASLGLVLASPLMLVTALAIKREDAGPVIFRQTRVGKDGVLFHCLKFRSMVTNADELKKTIDSHDGEGLLFKLKRDPRVTKVGRVIRRYSIDELPQLWNILRGEMSLVGPRPALESEVSRYEGDVSRRLAVRPGLTGLWQVSGRSDLPWEEAVRLDLYYVDNWAFVQDLAIMARTAKAVFSSRGAY